MIVTAVTLPVRRASGDCVVAFTAVGIVLLAANVGRMGVLLTERGAGLCWYVETHESGFVWM